MAGRARPSKDFGIGIGGEVRVFSNAEMDTRETHGQAEPARLLRRRNRALHLRPDSPQPSRWTQRSAFRAERRATLRQATSSAAMTPAAQSLWII